MPYCTSCGNQIPEGQGKSCSMCYGDPAYGNDGYYQEYLDKQAQEGREQQDYYEQQARAEAEQQFGPE